MSGHLVEYPDGAGAERVGDAGNHIGLPPERAGGHDEDPVRAVLLRQHVHGLRRWLAEDNLFLFAECDLTPKHRVLPACFGGP